MLYWDTEYLKLVKRILREGIIEENRTGVDAVTVGSHVFNFEPNGEFPILSSKQLFIRQAITEMFWIWQMGSNDVRELTKRGIHIWDQWKVDEDGIYRIYEPYGEYDADKEVEVIDPLSVPIDDPNGLIHEIKPKFDDNGEVMLAKSIIPGKTIRKAIYYGPKLANTIGTAYGFIVNRYGHTKNLIETLKKNPKDRKIVKSLWQDEFLRTAVLPSCVWATTWNTAGGKLNLNVMQRSCDVPLGLPFNVTQYAAFHRMIAKETGFELGNMSYRIDNAHIYVNQLDGIEEQLRRESRYNRLRKYSVSDLEEYKKKLEYILSRIDKSDKDYDYYDTEYRIVDIIMDPVKPELVLSDDVQSFFDYDNSREFKDVKVKNYKHMGKIKFNLTQ